MLPLPVLQAVNNSRLLWGLTMITVNMGSKYVLADVAKQAFLEKVLTHAVAKKVVLFCMFFLGSRDVIVACILTFTFSLLVQTLLHEHSTFSVLPASVRHALVEGARAQQQAAAHPHAQPVSHDQYKDALALVRRYEAGHHQPPATSAHHAHHAAVSTLIDRFMPTLAVPRVQ